MILRYDSEQIVYSRLNPIEDLMSWIAGLRSQGYVSDFLRETHGFANKEKIKTSAKAISCHAEYAVNLMNQGFLGSPDVCFLPIYYAMLNLAKIHIVIMNKLDDLKQQRKHGAAYNPMQKHSRDLLTEQITLHKKGAIPLYYQSIMNEKLDEMTIGMKEVYRFIRNTSYEFSEIYGREAAYQQVDIDVDGDDTLGYRLRASISQEVKVPINQIKVLKKFILAPTKHKAPDGTTVHNATGYDEYFTERIRGVKKQEAKSALINKNLNRQLLCVDFDGNGSIRTLTPITNTKVAFPEEIPILLAFYHMSNVVRYNPEMLEKLKDSRAWSLLLVLQRHGTLTFLELLWSAIIKKHLKICPEYI